MNSAIYIRVSTEDQAKEGYSLEVQREFLESFAKREGLDVFKIYQDDGISGYSAERPALSLSLAPSLIGLGRAIPLGLKGIGRPTLVGLKELLKDAKDKRYVTE